MFVTESGYLLFNVNKTRTGRQWEADIWWMFASFLIVESLVRVKV